MNITALTTDLYQINMCNTYRKLGIHKKHAVFDMFVRSLPENYEYLIACGIDEAIDTIKNIRFTKDDIDFLRNKVNISKECANEFKKFKFGGTIRAVPEGTIVYANEPIIEVSGTIFECQLIETILLSIVNYQTLIASKASRIVSAANGKQVLAEFGLRRAPGPEAGIRASRAAYIGGFNSTSNVEAGRLYDIPISGTMAHSFVMALSNNSCDEIISFRDWCSNNSNTTLLIDTYDVIGGINNVVQIMNGGYKVSAIRIDSGNLVENTKIARAILDSHGFNNVKIVVSNDLNEYKIAELIKSGAPIDAFGIGTDLVTARPEAALGGVYKLVEFDGKPKMKKSANKQTIPFEKNLFRETLSTEFNSHLYDIIALRTEECGAGRFQLLKENHERKNVKEIRDYVMEQLFDIKNRGFHYRATNSLHLYSAMEKLLVK